MKLDPLFVSKENKLFKIEDNSQVDLESIKKIDLLWSDLELEPESYNEEYLAKLRDDLKTMEEENKFAIIVPIVDKPLENQEDIESLTTACNHAARRIKDCISVIGFEIPKDFTDLDDMTDFVETLSKKHSQYIYFTRAENKPLDAIITY